MEMTQTRTLSRNELLFYLRNLRERIAELNHKTLRNVVFFNADSFYIYIRRQPCADCSTMDELLGLLEPYIPFTLSENNIELFLTGMMLPELEQERYQQNIARRAKIDFVFALKQMKTNEEWDCIENICEQLRIFHERSVL